MTPFVSRTHFTILGAATGWPAVNALGAGESAWESFTSMSTPPDRRAIVDVLAPWYVPELVATEAARGRLRRWAAAGGLAERDTPEARRAIIRRIAVVGDDMLQPLIEQALQRIPPPVLDHLRRHAVILPIGYSAAGFCGLEPAPEPDAVEVRLLLPVRYETRAGWLARRFRRPPRLTSHVDEFMATTAHECAHAWLLPAPTPTERLPRAEALEQHERLIRCATQWALLHKVISPREQDERQAEALAFSWGFTKATRGDACAWNARRMVLAEAAAIAVRDDEE